MWAYPNRVEYGPIILVSAADPVVGLSGHGPPLRQ